jgi:hypothetical protein
METTSQQHYQAIQASSDFFHILDVATRKCVGFAMSRGCAEVKIRILERKRR